jgi:hypothetical protein
VVGPGLARAAAAATPTTAAVFVSRPNNAPEGVGTVGSVPWRSPRKLAREAQLSTRAAHGQPLLATLQQVLRDVHAACEAERDAARVASVLTLLRHTLHALRAHQPLPPPPSTTTTTTTTTAVTTVVVPEPVVWDQPVVRRPTTASSPSARMKLHFAAQQQPALVPMVLPPSQFEEEALEAEEEQREEEEALEEEQRAVEEGRAEAEAGRRAPGIVLPPSLMEDEQAAAAVAVELAVEKGTKVLRGWKEATTGLHAKLMSPERKKKSPWETARAAEEKQRRAERTRERSAPLSACYPLISKVKTKQGIAHIAHTPRLPAEFVSKYRPIEKNNMECQLPTCVVCVCGGGADTGHAGRLEQERQERRAKAESERQAVKRAEEEKTVQAAAAAAAKQLRSNQLREEHVRQRAKRAGEENRKVRVRPPLGEARERERERERAGAGESSCERERESGSR